MIKKDPYDINETDKLFGIYRGVIEDNNDPDKLGRCKIRVWGIHTKKKIKEDTEGIPTEELPWSRPALSLFEGGVTGFGSFVVPLQGSHVLVLFEGGHILYPIYFASLPGFVENEFYGMEDPSKYGFCDPNEEYPIKETNAPHQPNALEESEYHRLARNEGISDTIVKSKTDNLDLDVEMATDNNWDEPDPYYEAEYPNNKVFTTHSGITIEIDDTNDEERIHIYHPSNSYIEINKDGNVIVRNEVDKYEIVRGTKRQHILVDEHKTTEVDRTKRVGRDQYERVEDDEYRHVIDNSHETIGHTEDEVKEEHDQDKIGGNSYRKVQENFHETIGDNERKEIGGNEYHRVINDKHEVIGSSGKKSELENNEELIGGNEFKKVQENKHETIGEAGSPGGNEYSYIVNDSNKIIGKNKLEQTIDSENKTVGSYNFRSVGGKNQTVTGIYVTNVNGVYNLTINGPISITSSSSVSVDAPIISLNSGMSAPMNAVWPSVPEPPESPENPELPEKPKEVEEETND